MIDVGAFVRTHLFLVVIYFSSVQKQLGSKASFNHFVGDFCCISCAKSRRQTGIELISLELFRREGEIDCSANCADVIIQ